MSPMGKPFPRRDRGSTVDFGGWSGLSERASHKLRNEEGKLTRTQGKKRKKKKHPPKRRWLEGGVWGTVGAVRYAPHRGTTHSGMLELLLFPPFIRKKC